MCLYSEVKLFKYKMNIKRIVITDSLKQFIIQKPPVLDGFQGRVHKTVTFITYMTKSMNVYINVKNVKNLNIKIEKINFTEKY